MARVIRLVEYNSRAISFKGTVVFASMGKFVTDFMVRFKAPGFSITPLTEREFAAMQAVSSPVDPDVDNSADPV